LVNLFLLLKKINVRITEEEFKKINGRSGAVYILSINEIINLNRVERVYEPKDIGQKNLFLPKPKPAFEKLGISEGMEKCFNTLKEKGLFKNFKNYPEWCERKNENKANNSLLKEK